MCFNIAWYLSYEAGFSAGRRSRDADTAVIKPGGFCPSADI